ncbi:MAG: hypothetical protein Q9171_000416 [Xanthocarpia ochracea]
MSRIRRRTHAISGQNIYFYSNHPIKWVRLVGVIVALDVYPNRVTMILDDSSGLTIEVFCRKDASTVTSTVDTSVDSYGGIQLNQVPVKKDHGHVCTTSEGKVNLNMFEVGSVVKIKGGISEFRGEKQVTLERISLVRTTSEEVTAWAENAAFYKNVMGKPWVVTERDQRRAKNQAAGLEQEREAKKERKQRRKGLKEKREERKGESSKSGRIIKPETVEATRSYKKKQAKYSDTG